MPGVSDFISMATAKLGVSSDAATSATGAVASVIQKSAGAADFGKLAAMVPGLSDLASKAAGGAGLGGALGGLAARAGGLLSGGAGAAAGVVAAVSGAGISGDKASAFLSLFVQFLKSKVPGDVLKAALGKVPGLSSLLG